MSAVRYWLAWRLQQLAWDLADPHDRWMIDYWMEGRKCALVHNGSWSSAKTRARELSGKIVGHNVVDVSASGPDGIGAGA